MVFQFVGKSHEFSINFWHIFFQLRDWLRCTNTSNNVFALCVDEVFTKHSFVTSCSISCESNTSTRCITHVTKYHHLDVYCCTPFIRNVIHSSVNECTMVVPASEHSHCGFQHLLFWILREVNALIFFVKCFEDFGNFFQLFARKICIYFDTTSFFVFIEFSFEFGFGNTDNYVREHHDETSVGIVCKSHVACFFSQTFNGNIVQTKVQNCIHHTRH